LCIIPERFTFSGKARRAGIFVALRFKNEQSSVGATSSEYAAPTGLADFIGSGFYKDVAPTALPVAGVLSVAIISMAKTKISRHGSEMGVFSQQLKNPSFKGPCCFGCFEFHWQSCRALAYSPGVAAKK
jgi:hypothetical protein